MRRVVIVLSLVAGIALFGADTDKRWQQMRHAIADALFVPSPLASVSPEVIGQFTAEPGVVAERVFYRTQFGMKVPAIVYRPVAEARSKRPAIVVVNGHGGDKYTWYSFYTGILYARAGAVVLTYDPIGEGERNITHKSGTRAHDKYVPPDEMGKRMGGLMVTDVMEAVSYLRGRSDVDPARIAAVGYSMGSFVLSIACAIDTRIHACVLAGGGNLDGPGGYWETSSKKMCQALPYQALSFLRDRPAALYALNADRGPTLVFNGSADEVVSIPSFGPGFFRELRQRTIQYVGTDRNVFEYEFEPGGGHRPYWVTRPVALWLQKHLGFPNWTESAIQSMPTTRIGEWVRQTGAPIDKGYADEHREGGTLALGTGVPNVSAELNVLPVGEWTAEKDSFVLESWLARAAAQIRAGEPRHSNSPRAR